METEGFGHDLVDDLENATCSSVLEIFPPIGSEVAGDFTRRQF